MSDRLVLDTGVLIRGVFDFESDTQVGVTALSMAELEFGLSAAAARGDTIEGRRRATRLTALRAQFGDGLPFDGSAVLAYGEVTVAILRRGRNPRSRSIDLLIAAVAVAAGAALVTTQPQEFAGLDGLVEIRSA